MLTNLQQEKFTKLFKLYDVDGNQFIENKDYETVIEGICRLRQLDENSPLIDDLKENFAENWGDMRALVDCDNDGKISITEWLVNTETQLATEEGFAHLAGNMSELIYRLFDCDNNGLFSLAEYKDFCWVFRTRGFNIEDNFKRLCPQGEGLSKEQFNQLFREFFGSDVDARGNALFGPIE